MYSWPHRCHSSPPPPRPPEGKTRKSGMTKNYPRDTKMNSVGTILSKVAKLTLNNPLLEFQNNFHPKRVSLQVHTSPCQTAKAFKDYVLGDITYLGVSPLLRSDPSTLCNSSLSSRNLDSYDDDSNIQTTTHYSEIKWIEYTT